MDIQKFVRKSFAVRGLQVTAENFVEVAEWANGTITGGSEHFPNHIQIDVKNALNERQKQAHVGDWVLNTKKGFKVYTDRAFHANFTAFNEPGVTVFHTTVNVPEGAKQSDYVLVNGHNPKRV